MRGILGVSGPVKRLFQPVPMGQMAGIGKERCGQICVFKERGLFSGEGVCDFGGRTRSGAQGGDPRPQHIAQALRGPREQERGGPRFSGEAADLAWAGTVEAQDAQIGCAPRGGKDETALPAREPRLLQVGAELAGQCFGNLCGAGKERHWHRPGTGRGQGPAADQPVAEAV